MLEPKVEVKGNKNQCQHNDNNVVGTSKKSSALQKSRRLLKKITYKNLIFLKKSRRHFKKVVDPLKTSSALQKGPRHFKKVVDLSKRRFFHIQKSWLCLKKYTPLKNVVDTSKKSSALKKFSALQKSRRPLEKKVDFSHTKKLTFHKKVDPS